jgi:hypothetical protein
LHEILSKERELGTKAVAAAWLIKKMKEILRWLRFFCPAL